MSLMPHQMKKCTQSMLRLLSLPALFIRGNLDIYFFDHIVSDFQHLLSSAHLERKMTNPKFPLFYIQKLFFGSDHGWREHVMVFSSPSKFWSRISLNSRNDSRERHLSWMAGCHRERFPQHFQEHAPGDLQEHQRVFQVQASDALSGQD